MKENHDILKEISSILVGSMYLRTICRGVKLGLKWKSIYINVCQHVSESKEKKGNALKINETALS